MNKPAPSPQSAFVIGANHRTSGLSLRDRLFVEDADIPAFLDKLRAIGLINGLVLSTCDRVEVQGMHAEPQVLHRQISEIFAAHGKISAPDMDGQLYLHQGPDAVRHIFSVVSALDSLVVGEPQVFGQAKAAHRLAKDAEMVSGAFEGLLQSAYGAAKRVRTETAIGERPVSIASAACEIAKGLHGDLSRLFVAMIGVGEMGELIARQFQAGGVKGLSVSHPISGRADPVASRLACHISPFDSLASALPEADIIICAMGRRHHSLSVDMVRAALKARRNRPQLIIDTGIPGDVEPAVNRLDDAFLYELTDLERVALEGLNNREAEAELARQLIEDEVSQYMQAHASRDAVPALTQLRQHFEQVQRNVINENPDDAARATELLISKLLHRPSQVLRQMAVDGKSEIEQAEAFIRRLFDLDGINDKNKNNKEDEQ